MTARVGPKRRTLYLGLVAVCLSGVAALRVLSFTFPWDIDAKTYAYVAERLLEGSVPYRDAWDQKPPGVHYLYALVFWLVGVSSLGLVAAKLLLEATSLIVLHALLRRLYDAATALLGAMLYAVFSSGVVLQRALLQAEHPMVLGVLGSLLCLVLWSHTGKERWLLVAGLSAGTAASFKQNALVILAGPILLAVSRTAVGSARLSVYRFARAAMWVAAGGMLPCAAWLLYLWGRGALPDFLVTFPFNEAYARRSVATFFLAGAVEAGRFFAEQSPLWLLVAAWIWYLIYAGSDASDRFVLAWTAGSVAGVLILGNFYNQYFIVLVPSFSAVAAIYCVRIQREYTRVRSSLPSLIPLAAILLIGFVSVFALKQIRVHSLVRADLSMEEVLEPVSRLIDVGGGPGETAYCWGINVLCWRQRAPTRFFYQYPFMLLGEEEMRRIFGRSVFEEIVEAIRVQRPRIVVVEDLELPEVETRPPAGLWAILDREYRRRERVVVPDRALTVDVYVRAVR
jgi:4-amino-4-deoxy-L-arabinose transferase-like glycosyltransferase